MIYRTIFVAVLAFSATVTSGQELPPNAVENDPDVHHVVFENEHVRVLDAKAAPGTKSPMHSHHAMVLVSLESARFKLTPAGGEPVIVDLAPGQVMWMDEGTSHSWELLAGNQHVIAVEVKSARE